MKQGGANVHFMDDMFGQYALDSASLSIHGTLPSRLVAIVGTRHPSPEAAEAAFMVARTLAYAGIGVVSGLALGIDGAAHEGALAGGGPTVAVLGHGLEVPVYPPQHRQLASRIENTGALVSPFAAETPMTRRTLLARNRWIAALASAVWVVQTGVPGGALAAAAAARQLGIPVCTSCWPAEQWRAGFRHLHDQGAEEVDVLTVVSRLYECAECGPPARSQGVLSL